MKKSEGTRSNRQVVDSSKSSSQPPVVHLPPIQSPNIFRKSSPRKSLVSLSQRSNISSPPQKGYKKGQGTFSKHEFLYLDGSEQECTFSPQIKMKTYSSTVKFYQNQIRIKSNKCSFEDFMSWKGKYELIDADQWIVQYLFPSLLGAQGDIDADIFRSSSELSKKIIKAYELMLDFYGFTLMSDISGDLILSHNHRERHEQTFHRKLSQSVHAYRIKRILQFLSKTGFLSYCKKFISFITVLIQGDKSIEKRATLEAPQRRAPVPILAHLNDILESEWKKFDQLDLANEMQQKHLKNVSIFFRSEKYAQSVFFSDLES